MRNILLVLAAVILAGCQYDPHGHLYTTSEPKDADIVGTYVLDRFELPADISIAHRDIEVELHVDGTFTATNVPPRNIETDKAFFASLLSGTGTWEKDAIGTLDPGSKSMWGVYLQTPDDRFHSANFTGDQPPYGLIFTLGDPDSGDAVILKRKPD
ncbi:MAG: hypothetical protein ACKVT0_18595 [Planctomycetaceae bacterium]